MIKAIFYHTEINIKRYKNNLNITERKLPNLYYKEKLSIIQLKLMVYILLIEENKVKKSWLIFRVWLHPKPT